MMYEYKINIDVACAMEGGEHERHSITFKTDLSVQEDVLNEFIEESLVFLNGSQMKFISFTSGQVTTFIPVDKILRFAMNNIEK